MTLGIIVGSVAISPLPDLVGDVFGVGAAPSTNPVTGKPQLSYRMLQRGELAVLPNHGHCITPAAVQVTLEFFQRQL